MAFGFPAYHTESFINGARSEDLREAVYEALEALRWWIQVDSDEIITAFIGISFWSWGEWVTIRFLRNGSLVISSRCAWPTQCVDWGKNQSNVTMFSDELRKAAWLRTFTEQVRPGKSSAALSGQDHDSQDIQNTSDAIE
jgi:hypothetical protein